MSADDFLWENSKFSCIIVATSYCRYTSLYILFKWSLYWLSDGVGGGSGRNALRQSQLHTGTVKTGIMMMIPRSVGHVPTRGLAPFLGGFRKGHTILEYKDHIIASGLRASTQYITHPGSGKHAYRMSHSVYGGQMLCYRCVWSTKPHGWRLSGCTKKDVVTLLVQNTSVCHSTCITKCTPYARRALFDVNQYIFEGGERLNVNFREHYPNTCALLG